MPTHEARGGWAARWLPDRARWAVLAILLVLGWSSAASGQTVPISGRVTSTAGAPLAGARVEARDPAAGEGAAASTITNGAGRYLVRVRPGREYALSVELPGFVGGTVLVEAAAGGAIRDLRLAPEMGTPTVLDGLTVRAPPRTPQAERRGEAPGASLASRSASIATRYPGDPGDLAASAGTSGQVIRGAGGLSIAGQGPSANRTTVDGAGFDAGSLPPEALAAAGVIAHPYDVARGQFTGGELAGRTMSGTNLWGGAFRMAFQNPSLAYGARERMATGRLGGGGGGPIVPGRLFVYGAGQVVIQESPARALDPDNPRLSSLGVSADSARRLLQIVDRLGVRNAREADARSSTSAILARFDYLPGSRHSLTLRIDARRRESDGFGSPFSASGGGETREESGGVLFKAFTRFRGGATHDASVYLSSTDQRSAPGAALPAGELWLRSDLVDGSRGISTLSFGGDAHAWPAEDRSAIELSDRITIPLGRGAHQLQAGALYLRERVEASAMNDRFGTFTFATLADVEAGRPVRFTRWLGSGVGEAVTATHALYAGDLWTPRRGLRVTWGVRAERTAFDLPGALDPGESLAAEPGTSPWLLSPRAGFTWTRNTPETEWVVRGGAGRFRAAPPTRSLAALRVEPGLGYGVRLECMGDAVPAPRWEDYRSDPSSVPSRCVGDGATGASDPAGATGFTRGFGVPALWRASLESFWLLKKFDTSLEVTASASRGRGLPLGIDHNLAASPAFTLADEGGRPVYAAPGAIDPTTGRAVLSASRRRDDAGVIRAVDAAGRSASEQISVSATRMFGMGLLRAHYTLTRSRDHAPSLSGLAESLPSTAGDPRRASWAAADFEQRHAFQLSVDRSFARWLSLTLYGSVTSGAPFTPMVDTDVNGDGFANDRAFVFDPGSAREAGVAREMAELIDRAPAGVRSCLRGQLGRVAARNSCRGPWNPRLDVQLNLRPRGVQRGAHFMVVGENITAALDRYVHGADDLRGWGQDVSPNPVLLRVTGFDPSTRRYAYEVNPSFGRDLVTRRPFAVRLQVRLPVGADPATQAMMSSISTLRASAAPEDIRREILRQWQNTPSLVLGGAAERNVQLDPQQRSALRAAADSVARGVAVLASALVETEITQPAGTTELLAQAQSLLMDGFEQARATLTREQWSRLPLLVRSAPRAVIPLGSQNTILIAPDL
ncbi:MAG TPA: carboxypeptidase-like regulatory domain-containing protein [Longimicrobium sp.]